MTRLTIALLSFFATVSAALAQTEYSGDWHFEVDGYDAPVMVMSLSQSEGRVTGTGNIDILVGVLTPGQVRITQGAAFDGLLQLQLALPPNEANGILSVFDDGLARLTLSGQTIEGQFTSSTSGGTPAGVADIVIGENVCAEMRSLQSTIILGADADTRSRLDGIYDRADETHGRTESDARCAFLLGELTRISEDTGTVTSATTTTTTTTPVTPTTTTTVETPLTSAVPTPTGVTGPCAEVGDVVQAVYAELTATGQSDDGTIQQILDDSGLGTNGIWSTGACVYGISNLQDYLTTIGTGGGQVSGTPTTIKDPTAPISTGNGLRDIAFQVYDVSENLNMRSGPGTGFSVVYQLPYFARDLRIIGQGCSPGFGEAGFASLPPGAQAAELQGQWCNVEWNGQRGWVAGRYIRAM